MNKPQMTIADVTPTSAILDLTWPEPIDPPYVRVRMIPYDGDKLVWLGRTFGMTHAIDLAEGTLTVGNAAYELTPAVLRTLSEMVC